MIIYIPLEVPVRELQGYLLLAVVAASRGHQVVIGSSTDLWLYKRLNILEKGVYFVKNINIPKVSEGIYRSFVEDGFDLYCQEQEPPILRSNFKTHIDALSISKGQYLPFKSVFCWGDRSTLEYKRLFKAKQDIFLNTGSPRLDLLKDKFLSLKKSDDQQKPYILVVSNFGLTMGKRHWSEILVISRNLEHLESHEQERRLFGNVQQDCELAVSMILAVKHLSRNSPKHEIVIRPHPTDNPEYWGNIFGESNNIRVIGNSDSITPWIKNASVIIQNGCTTAFEAVIQKVPLISFGPDRTEIAISNMLGMRAKSIEDLDNALKCIFEDERYDDFQIKSESVIEPLVSITKDNPSLEMLKSMEEKSSHLVSYKVSYKDVLTMRVVKLLKLCLVFVRNILGSKSMDSSIISLNEPEINRELAILSKIMDVPKPQAKFVNKKFFIIGDI